MKLFIKSVFSIAAVCALLLVAGCGGDDPKPVSPIVGKWNIISTQGKITPSTAALVAYLVTQGLEAADAELLVEEFLDSGDDALSGTIEFKNDGTFQTIDGTDDYSGKWELSADGKILTTDKGTVSELVGTVNKLDSTDAEIEFDESESLSFPPSTGLEFHIVLVLKKA